MKKICFFTIIITLLACSNEKTESIDNTSNEKNQIEINFDWLLGDWQRINETGNKKTYESWDKNSDYKYTGYACTIENSDTVWEENILLINRDSIWVYEVFGKGDTIPVIFTLTTIDSLKFISENPEHDFPKKITYNYISDTVKATISDDSIMIPFTFVKKR